jgi:hypothetical protein
MIRNELFDFAEKSGLGFIRHASDKDIEKFESFAQLVAEAERKKYEDIITNMAKLLEVQQSREGVAIDMIAAGIAREREACAKVVENILLAEGADVDDVILRLAEDIRARGQA